ncbi:MAG: hypothetical protein IJC57_02905 [Clostridia bacterium]|nr:hypothetical protein [Clostridia bacterium]
MEIRCEKCGQEEGQIKNGRTKAGNQRYRCKHCGKTYTPVKKERWIRQKAKKIKPKNRSNERVEVIEMDELFTFKERKNSNLHYDSCQQKN